MGCSQSKAVAAPAPASVTGASTTAAPTTAPSPMKRSGSSHSFHSKHSKSGRQREDSVGTNSLSASPARKKKSTVRQPSSPAKTIMNGGGTIAAMPDNQWKVLWQTQPHPIDPADVPAVISDLMARQTNKLLPTEITLLQRRVRFLSKLSQQKKGGRFRMSTETAAVEKQHTLDEVLVKRLWMSYAQNGSTSNEFQKRFNLSSETNSDVDMVSSAVVLLSHLGEPLWERVAWIAADAAEQAGLEMDVNKKSPSQKLAPPTPALEQYEAEESLSNGISFHSACFLMALALRGTRMQRLQLLFYLLIPPAELHDFLQRHPAGGIPTWLLEVDNDTVISITSLAHYFYFGDTFLPTTPTLSSRRIETSDDESLHVSPLPMMEAIANLLTTSSQRQLMNGGSPIERKRSPMVSTHGSRHKKASVDVSESSAGEVIGTESAVLDYLQTHTDDYLGDFMERFWAACEGRIVTGDVDRDWNMEMWFMWANEALDDIALDCLMSRLFGSLPSPQSERSMILQKWQDWQQADVRFWTLDDDDQSPGTIDYLSHFRHYFRLDQENGEMPTAATRVWGGIGGFDGRGGLGHGIMYCVEKKWWDDWMAYVGWNWEANMNMLPQTRRKPGPISTDRLIDHSEESVVGGTLGSYELMKSGLTKDVDYVLVPPGVWDVLYELYGGGPPLPRMVLPPPRMERRTRTFSSDSKQMEDEDVISTDTNIEVVAAKNAKLFRIPEAFAVATRPLVLHCNVCDAQQPYRRGDAGPMSIRVMATPDQPLWRLYAEIIVRLPIQNAKAVDKDGRGQARLWREIESEGPKDPSSRYGPWSLLCKNRSAIMPIINLDLEFEDSYDELKKDWLAYTDHATVEGIGLVNGDRIMLEYAVQNKAGEFIWPREAAAKASRLRRLADDDLKLRRLLRGVDEDDKPIVPPPEIVGTEIDAMDVSGRWFQVGILEVHVEEEAHDLDEEVADGPVENGDVAGAAEMKKEIRVDFTEFGGHSEWIDIESDRLATAGRFTLGKPDDDSEEASVNPKNGGDTKTKAGVTVKKSTTDATDQNAGKVCLLPGYGACGLANLGNTCYANSAIQCISYLPLLRAYLLSAQYKASGDLNKDNPLGTGGKLLEEFADLLRVMWLGKYGERSPTRFKSQLGKARSQFAGADQQDAQEFLNYILDVLHEDSNKIKKKPYVEGLEDDWVKSNSLVRVGDESWRRFLRRNRSVIADVAMGQVLNTVTCPVCNFSSRNFDPFNLLSLPFPTVADVVFVCTVVRRATPFNCPRVLNRPRKGDKHKKKRYDLKKLKSDPNAPSDTLVIEQYAVAMSRLADIGDLKLRLQNISGIPASHLKLCKLEEVVLSKDTEEGDPVMNHQKVTALPDKEGPCVQLARSLSSSEDGNKAALPTRIIAFEKTLRPRPPMPMENGDKATIDDPLTEDDDATTAEEDDDDSIHQDSRAYSPKDRRMILERMKTYGDKTECRLFDSDPLPLQKAMSRTLWPRTSEEFKLGLRVDAIDHREHWFPGSVVEIIEGVASDEEKEETVSQVKVHFDNFSAKWDETYEIDAFTKGQVQPLYSHATPRMRPTEFPVYHRFADPASKKLMLFGQGFYIQCPPEWSTARAGAHILAQASRFMQKPEIASHGPIDVDEIDDDALAATTRLYDRMFSTVNELIDVLVDGDRQYVRESLGISEKGHDLLGDSYRNPDYDSEELSSLLGKKVTSLMNKLPLEVRLITIEFPCGGGKKGSINEEAPFPFSLMRTIGNFINARHAIALHWRDPPAADKKYSARSVLNKVVMYQAPPIAIHKSITDVLNESKAHGSKNNPGSGGMDLSVCLSEFCKPQKLELSDCWRCPRCKDFREGKQHMDLWRLPDLLTFHIKRFNCSARWREKITTKVNFPLTGLDMSDWCHSESVCVGNAVYDLIGVMNHYGGMTGGHYVATCKATACGPDGREEVAYSFPGAGANVVSVSDETDKVGWRLGGIRKEKEMLNQNKVTAAAAAKYASESSEPLWLQFDDELVEPIPPRNVVSEMAYVLFYRRRHLSSANIAKYSTLE